MVCSHIISPDTTCQFQLAFAAAAASLSLVFLVSLVCSSLSSVELFSVVRFTKTEETAAALSAGASRFLLSADIFSFGFQRKTIGHTLHSHSPNVDCTTRALTFLSIIISCCCCNTNLHELFLERQLLLLLLLLKHFGLGIFVGIFLNL